MPSFPPSYPSLELNTQPSIPELLDFHLQHNPDFSLYVFADDDSNGPTEISMLEYIRASHRAGTLIRDAGDSQPGEIIAIIATLDTIVFSAMITGMIKAGLVPFPISILIPPDAVAKLIRENNICRVITASFTLRDFLASVREKLGPSYDCHFEDPPSLSVLYPKLGRETAEDEFSPLSNPSMPSDEDPAMCMHSSGSTGLPKTIRYTHLLIRETRCLNIRLGAFGLAFFHASALYSYIMAPLYGPTTAAVFPPMVTRPDALPVTTTAENIIEHLERTKATALFSQPNFFTTFARSPKVIAVLKRLVFVLTGGGFIPTSVGEHLVSSGVRLRVIWGATECGAPTLLSLEDEEWNSFKLTKEMTIRWVPYGEELFRCHLLTSDKYQPAVENLPYDKGFEVPDLFERHPTKADFWRIVGRVDDVLAQANGQKTLPGPMEDATLASHLVKGAVLFGRGHVHLGVLIELSSGYEIDMNNPSEVDRVRNEVWPLIEGKNKDAAQYSQIVCKEMILIASSDKPLPRAAKGTVNKAASMKLYAAEIEDIYKAAKLD
ncbi:hypothetical protein D9758_003944 [Tetrapyrgos nigripes]|uniref:AMP-dependent synthetase/ligase domain-containing protein n=1 Tax=Tetrapyrgos nigripes TaxID=182062 RepID=A0A8H5GL40_9AGAR|nr:hypothetical protein D9758_003944 [Tetrapyrgos nigripes]